MSHSLRQAYRRMISKDPLRSLDNKIGDKFDELIKSFNQFRQFIPIMTTGYEGTNWTWQGTVQSTCWLGHSAVGANLNDLDIYLPLTMPGIINWQLMSATLYYVVAVNDIGAGAFTFSLATQDATNNFNTTNLGSPVTLTKVSGINYALTTTLIRPFQFGITNFLIGELECSACNQVAANDLRIIGVELLLERIDKFYWD